MNMLYQSNKEFMNTFSMTSSGWRGRKVLTRNLINSMGNSGDKKYIEVLQELREKRPELKYYIDIAIDKLMQK